MLDKIKRFFSLNTEVSQETISDTPRACYRLKTISYTNTELRGYKIKSINCGETGVINTPLNQTSGVININRCVKSDSMEEYILNEFGDTAPFITASDIQNAVLYNNGILVFDTIDTDQFILDFGYCRTESTPVLVEEGLISSISNTDNVGTCAYSLDTTMYFKNLVSGQINVGTLVYTNSIGTTVFNGSNRFYLVKLPTQIEYAVRINNGEIIEISFCL
jgi:hypothetical protein